MHRPSQIPMSSHLPRRRSSSAEPPMPSQQQWQAANNLIVHPQSRESMAARQSSMGRASSISRASMAKPGAEKQMSTFEMAQTISFTLNTVGLDVAPKMILTPVTNTFYSLFEYLLEAIGFKDVWSPNYLTGPGASQKPGGSQMITSSQPMNQAQINANNNKARLDSLHFYLNFFDYPNIPKPSVFQTMTTPKNWTIMLQILYFLANNVKFLSTINVSKILYQEEKNREFINDFLRKMFARTVSVPDFANSEEFKREKEEALKAFKSHLENSLNWNEINQEYQSLREQHKQLSDSANELEDLTKNEENLKREMEREELELQKRIAKLEEVKKKIVACRKEQLVLNEKLRASEQEKAMKESEYERQAASSSFKENLPQLQKQLLQELENLENAVYDLDNKQVEWQEKITSITELLKDKIEHSNDLVTKLKTESLIDLKDLPQLNILDFNNKKPMVIKDYKDMIHKVRKEYNSKVCRLPQMASQIRDEKNAVANHAAMLRTKAANLDSDLKKLDHQFRDLKNKSENALADAKLRVSQTHNEQKIRERELNTREAELRSEVQKVKNEKEIQDKIILEYESQMDEIAKAFATEYYELLNFREEREREFNEFKQAEIARLKESAKQMTEKNEERRKKIELRLA